MIYSCVDNSFTFNIGSNVCENNNGGCSHICFPLPAYTSDRSTQSGCMCPDFYALLPNNKTCISIGKFKCVI